MYNCSRFINIILPVYTNKICVDLQQLTNSHVFSSFHKENLDQFSIKYGFGACMSDFMTVTFLNIQVFNLSASHRTAMYEGMTKMWSVLSGSLLLSCFRTAKYVFITCESLSILLVHLVHFLQQLWETGAGCHMVQLN